jgi:hypothetical protein
MFESLPWLATPRAIGRLNGIPYHIYVKLEVREKKNELQVYSLLIAGRYADSNKLGDTMREER